MFHKHKGRSPVRGSKGRKLLNKMAPEMEAEIKIKRYNLVTLLDKLFEALNGTIQQDNLVELVKSEAKNYQVTFKQKSNGLAYLLSKWGVSSKAPVLGSGRADGNMGVVAIYDGDVNDS